MNLLYWISLIQGAYIKRLFANTSLDYYLLLALLHFYSALLRWMMGIGTNAF